MASSDFEKLLELYIGNPDVFYYAYVNCPEYKKFFDSLSVDIQNKFRRAHAALRVSNGAYKFQEGIFHVATFGLSYGAKKLFNRNKKSKKELIVEMVESEEFIGFFKALNNKGE